MVKLTEDMVIARSKGSELHNVKKLNCWGSELHDVTVVKKLTNVEVLSLSVNNISTLQEFECCCNLQELYIRKNNIKDINDVLYLRQLPKLKSLWLNDNPCSEFEQYRLTVLRALPHLQKLDNVAVEPEEVQKALVYGIPLPKEPWNRRGSQTSLPLSQSGQLEESYLHDSSANSFAGSSPVREQHTVPKSNSYCNSLEEGYDHSRNLYDEDDEQVVRRRQAVEPKKSQTEEAARPTYASQARNPNPEMYRRGCADYEDEKSSVASSQLYQPANRRQSYGGNATQPKAQVRQVSLRANVESQADNDYDYRPYTRLDYGNSRNTSYVSRDDPYASRYNNAVTNNYSPLSPDANKNNRNDTSEVGRRLVKDHQPEMAWTAEEYAQNYEISPRTQHPMETASIRSSSDNPPCPRTFNSRPKSKNANLLSAVLCLIKELDYHCLEVAEMAIHRRMDELED